MFGLTPYNRRNNEVTRRNEVWDLRSLLDDFFSDSLFPSVFNSAHPIKADVRETDKEYIIDAEIPGAKKEDIKLDLRDDTLTIMVQQNAETKEEKENYIRRERRYGSYSRSFYVENVKQENVTAKYNDGILSVVLPKAEPTKQTNRNIDIQ